LSARGLGCLVLPLVEPSDELFAQPQKDESVLEVLEVMVVDPQMRQCFHYLREEEEDGGGITNSIFLLS